MFLILLAGLTAINPEIREAAAIDGASAWQTVRFFYLLKQASRPAKLQVIQMGRILLNKRISL